MVENLTKEDKEHGQRVVKGLKLLTV